MTYASGGLIQATDYNSLVGADTTDYRNLHMAATGGCGYSMGGVITKTSGTDGTWSGQVYSYHGYVKSAYMAVKFNTNHAMMAGLNSDPAANDSYTTIDYAWYWQGGGAMQIYENGALIGTYATGNMSSVYSIYYDGITVFYMIDGVVQRSVARAEGAALHFDSSIVNIGANFRLLIFAPVNNPVMEPYWYSPTGMTVTGSTFVKTGGTNGAWDVGVQSLLSFSKYAYVSFRASQTTACIMLGLNESPTEPHVYSNIDYAWYPRADGVAEIYENGALIGTYGTYTTSTVFSIYYDGVNVHYMKDGVIQRTVARAYNGTGLYVDSSFYTTNGALNQVTFMQYPNIGKQRGVGWGGTGLGQSTSAITPVAAGNSVSAAQWTGLIQSTNSCLAHEGLPQITPSSVTSGSIITYYNDINRGNALSAGYSGNTGVALSDAAANVSSTTISWGTTGNRLLQFQQHYAFPSADARRYFFNAGGKLKISWARSGGSATVRNTDWTNLLAACGQIQIGAYNAVKVGGSGTANFLANNGNGGLWSGRGNWTPQFYQYDTAAGYTNDYIICYILVDGSSVHILTQLFNAHVQVFQDAVDGTCSSSIVVGYPSTTYLTNTWGTPSYVADAPVTY